MEEYKMFQIFQPQSFNVLSSKIISPKLFFYVFQDHEAEIPAENLKQRYLKTCLSETSTWPDTTTRVRIHVPFHNLGELTL